MEATPSVHFNFEDTSAKRTPWLQGLSKEQLSFGLSASSQHPQQMPSHYRENQRLFKAKSPYQLVRPGEWAKFDERSLARSILQEIENAQSPARQRVQRLRTDEFFEQFDRVFEVRFDSPAQQNDSALEIQQSTQPINLALKKDFSQGRHPYGKVSPSAIDRKTESCSLGQSRNPKNKPQRMALRRKQRLERKPATTSNTYRAGELKELAKFNGTGCPLSIYSVEAKERLENNSHVHQAPTIRRKVKQSRMEIDELHTILGKHQPSRDMFLRSGTLQNWKRKFHERRQRSRDNDLAQTVKIRSLGCKRRKAEPIRVVDFHIQRKLRA